MRGSPAWVALVVAVTLAATPAASAMVQAGPREAAAAPATPDATVQGVIVGTDTSGPQITQFGDASGPVGSTGLSGTSLGAVAFAPGAGGVGSTAYVAARGSDPSAYSELVPVTTGSSGPSAGTAIPIPNADYPGGAPSLSPHPSAVAVSPDGEAAYVVDQFNGVVFPINDLISGTPTVGTPISGFSAPTSVAVSPDGSTVYVLDDNGVNVIDAATDTVTETLPVPGAPPDTPASMALSPDGTTAYVTTFTSSPSTEETLYAVPLSGASPAAVATIPFSGADAGQTIAIAPDGDTAYVEGDPSINATNQNSAQVAVVDLAAHTFTTLDLGTAMTSSSQAVAYDLAITPDGSTVYATESCPSVSAGICSTSDAGTLYAIDTSTDTVSATYSTMGTPLAIGLPPVQSSASTGTGPVATLGAQGLNFGSETVGDRTAAQTVSLTNTGDTSLAVSGVTLGGSGSGDFSISSDGCAGQTVSPGASCAMSVTFSPTGAGARSATLTVADDAPGSPQTVSLVGTGVAAGTTTPPAGGPVPPPVPTNGTGTLYGLADPPGTEISLYRGSSTTPAYEGLEDHAFAYTGTSHIEPYGTQGQYTISGITPGTYRVQGFSFATGDVDSVSQVTITADQITRSDVVLSPGEPPTGGVSVNTGFGSQGPLPMALVGIPFQVSVPIKAGAAAPNSIAINTYTLSFGPQTTLADAASTATYNVFIYYTAKGVPEFIGAQPATSPAPTSTYGAWNLSQASAGLTIGSGLGSASTGARVADDENGDGIDIFNGELTPAVADGGTENVSVTTQSTVFNWTKDLKPLVLTPARCPPDTTPVEHIAEAADPSETRDDIEDLQGEQALLRGAMQAPGVNPYEQAQIYLALSPMQHDINQMESDRLHPFYWYDYVPKPPPPPAGSIYVDPSGKVTSNRGVPLADAKVVLEHSTSANGRFTAPKTGSTLMSPSNRRDPSFTDALGLFGWEVQPGYYKVRASAPGCHAGTRRHARTVRTKVFAVPPPVTAIGLKLTCPGLKRSASRISLALMKDSQTVTVRVRGRRHATPLGIVTVKLDGRRLARLPLVGGRASVLVPSHGTLSAGYSGDGHYTPSTAHLRITRPRKTTAPAARASPWG